MPKLDREMLEWTGDGDGARLMMLVLHDDAELTAPQMACRRSAPSHEDFVDEAKKKAWTIISMKNDWKTIFPEGDR